MLLLGSAGPCLLSILGREACGAGERPWMKSICPNDRASGANAAETLPHNANNMDRSWIPGRSP
eukprot:6910754-Alexandrium_andersonii.AAC.1